MKNSLNDNFMLSSFVVNGFVIDLKAKYFITIYMFRLLYNQLHTGVLITAMRFRKHGKNQTNSSFSSLARCIPGYLPIQESRWFLFVHFRHSALEVPREFIRQIMLEINFCVFTTLEVVIQCIGDIFHTFHTSAHFVISG